MENTALSPGQRLGYEALLEAARHMARRWSRRPEDVDDLAQEALLKLVAVGSEVQKPLAWLKVIVRRLAWRQIRGAPEAGDLLPGVDILFDPWQCRDEWMDLGDALRTLPRRTQAALVLVAQGHTEREIALALRCSVKAVEKVLHGGRRRLRNSRSSSQR